jgi:uncharacterized MAPEG superfamily protein
MNTLPVLSSASVTALIVLFYLFTAIRVGILRGKHGIRAPLCTGHPQFDRAYRVQLNTLEQMGIVLPLLWLTTLYPVLGGWPGPAIAVIWVIGRPLYSAAYMADPDKRIAAAGIGGLCNVALLITALIGIGAAWLHTLL